MGKRIAIFLISAPLAIAQKFELGVSAGGGTFTAEDVGAPVFVNFGVEACAWCSGHFSLFGEYSHWESSGEGSRSSRITRADLVAGGLRIQGGRSLRPFFDVGFAGGWDQFEWSGGRGSHGNPGVVLGGGVAIALGEHWYLRPQGRVYALRGIHAAAGASIGVGYRF